MIRYQFQVKETVATILADDENTIHYACTGMSDTRFEIERYIREDPFFKTSFGPIAVKSKSFAINSMSKAAFLTGVGPMAAVAATIAVAGIIEANNHGSRFCVIDNGGDIALISDRVIKIGLYAGSSPISGKYAFVIPPKSSIYGVCTSSATVGPSISLGIADSVTVFSDNPSLADAVATGVCNSLAPDDKSCLDDVPSEIDGIFAVFGDISIVWGKIPKLVKTDFDEKLITAGISGI